MLRSTAILAALAAVGSQASAQHNEGPRGAKDPIVVTSPLTPAERRAQLRDFTREVVREPRRGHPIAKFFYPVCPRVIGIADPAARAIEDRIRENAVKFGLEGDTAADCTPTIRVAFMAPAAGPPDSWLNEESPQIAHLPIWQRRELLSEEGPVRAFNRVVVRDFHGEPMVLDSPYGRVFGEQDTISLVGAFNAAGPLMTTEITGAAILIERDAADGFTLAQLADYITMRTLVGTSTPGADAAIPAPTILTLFQDSAPPEGLTSYDASLLEGTYGASRNSSERRVISDVARIAVKAERGAGSDGQ